MRLKLEEEKLRALLAHFNVLTGVRIVIFDNEFVRIMAYPEDSCEFCRILKNTPEFRRKCHESDRVACLSCKNTAQLFVYRCHAGLVEAVAPIKMNDLILGYIMFGQVVEKSRKESCKQEILNYCSEFFADDTALSTAYDHLSAKSQEQIEAASKIMESCTCYLWVSNLIQMDSSNLLYHLTNYIDHNLKSTLTAEKLCEVFHISRTHLYELSNQYFGMGIAKYIRKKRLKLAAKYLSEQHSTVSEAAGCAGFEDYNYFSKMFKQEFGCTPRQYRLYADIEKGARQHSPRSN